MRGIAVVLVVVYHARWALSGGYVGVDVFFVVSGFVIAGLLWRELSGTGTIRGREFYARRARRLMPSVTVAIGVCVLLSVLLLSPARAQQAAARTAAAGSAFSANGYLYRFGVPYFDPAERNPFIHLWSLGVEEQTYLVLPLLLLGLSVLTRRARAAVRRGVVVCFVAVSGLASFVLAVATTARPAWIGVPLPAKFAFYLPATRWWEFAAGALLAIVPLPRARSAAVPGAAALVGLGFIVVAAVRMDAATAHPGVATLLPVFGTVLVLAAGTVADRCAARGPRALVWIGDRSYNLYLWHWPLLVFAWVTWPGLRWLPVVAIAVAVVVSDVVKRTFEDRLRTDRRLIGGRAALFAVVCMALPIGAASVLAFGADRGWGVDSLKAIVDSQRRTVVEAAGCDSAIRHSGCEFGGSSGPLVVLVGDSHAAAIADVTRSVSEAAGWRFGAWTRSACPLTLGPEADPAHDACDEWSVEVMRWVDRARPSLLLLHFGTGFYVDAVSGGTSLDGYERTLRAAAQRVAAWGGRVAVVADLPVFEKSELTDATLLRAHPSPATRPEADVRASSAALMAMLGRLRSDGVLTVVDPVTAVCEAGVCSQYRDGWIYRDGDHLSPLGASLVAPLLAPLFA